MNFLAYPNIGLSDCVNFFLNSIAFIIPYQEEELKEKFSCLYPIGIFQEMSGVMIIFWNFNECHFCITMWENQSSLQGVLEAPMIYHK